MRKPGRKGLSRQKAEDEIAHLRNLDLSALRARWLNESAAAPKHLTRYLLFKVLAYNLQADGFGDLDAETSKALHRTGEGDGKASAVSQKLARLDQRRYVPPAGTVLVREWDRKSTAGHGSDGRFCLEWPDIRKPIQSGVCDHRGTNGMAPAFSACGTVNPARPLETPDEANNPTKGPLRDLHPCLDRARARAGVQLARQPARGIQAYIKSQAHEGWRLPARYDDGGFSGGSMERPALQRLLARSGPRSRRDRRLQGRSPDPIARPTSPSWSRSSTPRRLVRLGDPAVQHHDLHGAAHPQRAAVLRSVRAGGHGRAHPGQDRRIEAEGHLDGW